MKARYFNLILIFSLLAACSEDELNPKAETIFGVWQLTESYDGGSLEPLLTVENGYSYTFNSDSTFKISEGVYCEEGVESGIFSIYQDSENRFVLALNVIECSDQDSFTIEYTYGFNDDKLIISPKENSCDEGCYYSFSRIDE